MIAILSLSIYSPFSRNCRSQSIISDFFVYIYTIFLVWSRPRIYKIAHPISSVFYILIGIQDFGDMKGGGVSFKFVVAHHSSPVQSKNAISAYFTTEQILPFGFAERICHTQPLLCSTGPLNLEILFR